MLHRTRPVGFGPGAIQVQEVLAVADLYQVENRLAFLRIVQELDQAFLAFYEARHKKP